MIGLRFKAGGNEPLMNRYQDFIDKNVARYDWSEIKQAETNLL